MATKKKKGAQKTRMASFWDELAIEHIAPHSVFSLDLINLAQDLAIYYASMAGLSVPGVSSLSLAMQCWVVPHTRIAQKNILIGGLATYYVGLATAREGRIFCHISPKSPDPDKIVTAERLRLLVSAPLFCRSDPDGAALLKRIWQFVTPAERRVLYGATAFSQMARRLSLRTRNLPGAPIATTCEHYEQLEIPFPKM